METNLLQKLVYKPDAKALLVNKPAEFNFTEINYDEKVRAGYSFAVAFMQKKSDMEITISQILSACTEDAIIWIAYPKKGSTIKTDLTRDQGWEALAKEGYRPVSQISMNENWSALRFKPVTHVKSSPLAQTQTFEAVIQGDDAGGAWVKIPFDVKAVYGTSGQVKVQAAFDGHPYQGSIANMGSGHILIVKKDIRTAINKTPGERVNVKLQEDKTERVVVIPEALQLLLSRNPNAAKFFNSLSYTNRKEFAGWIASAKRAETKAKRLNETLDKLNNGIKNPFMK